MEFNYVTFISGLGCGICIGISLIALKKYLGSVTETAKAVKKVIFSVVATSYSENKKE